MDPQTVKVLQSLAPGVTDLVFKHVINNQGIKKQENLDKLKLAALDARIKRIQKIEELRKNPETNSVATAGKTPSLFGKAEKAWNEGDIKNSCLGCARAHLIGVYGSLEEALRFARREGVYCKEVQDRLLFAEKEIVNLERFDWSPENIHNAPKEEKTILNRFLPWVRELRQQIVAVDKTEALEEAAAVAGNILSEFRTKTLELTGKVSKTVENKLQALKEEEITPERVSESGFNSS